MEFFTTVALLLLGILVPSEGLYVLNYVTSKCSGNAVAGASRHLDVCDDVTNTMSTCISGTINVSTYSGPKCTGSISDTSALKENTCTWGHKGSCSGSTSGPFGSVTLKTWNSGQCSGSPSLTGWFSLGACIPDIKKGSSSKYVARGDYVLTTWNASLNCTGPNEVSILPAGSSTTYYSSSGASFSGLIGYNIYGNNECTGTPTVGLAFASSQQGKCVDQKVVTCANGVFTLAIYDTANCTGNASTTTVGTTCDFGVQAFCSGKLTIPGSYQAVASYVSTDCGGHVKLFEWSLMKHCIVSGATWTKSVYLNNQVVTDEYSTPNCTGTVVSTTAQFLYSVSTGSSCPENNYNSYP